MLKAIEAKGAKGGIQALFPYQNEEVEVDVDKYDIYLKEKQELRVKVENLNEEKEGLKMQVEILKGQFESLQLLSEDCINNAEAYRQKAKIA